MSEPIGRVGGSNVTNTNNNIENDAISTQDNFGPSRAPNPSDRNSDISFKGGMVITHAQIPDNFKVAIDSIRQPKPSNSIGNKLGRAFLWIINLFKGVRSSNSLSTHSKLDILRNKKPAPLPDNVSNKGRPYIFTPEQLGNLCGLDKGIKINYFEKNENSNKNYKEILFPQGEPRLSDIKQNAELQDCWFLSSISSMIQSQGTESIERLFTESKTPGNVIVRLGANLYDVPMGRIESNGGDKFGSDSSNWVVTLENAMLMHLALSAESPDVSDPKSLETYKTAIRMPMNLPTVGLIALHGYKREAFNSQYEQLDLYFASVEDGVNYISQLLKLGKPCVIGQTSEHPQKVAMRDGISPNHAVTVLEVVPKGFKILDPYGQVKTLPKESIVDYTLHTIRRMDEPDENYVFTSSVKPKEVSEAVKDLLKQQEDDF